LRVILNKKSKKLTKFNKSSGIIKKSGKDNISFRNKALLKNSVDTYTCCVQEYHKYLKENNLKDGIDGVKGFLKIIKSKKSAKTFNLTRQAVKEYLSEEYKDTPIFLFGIQELFKSIKRAKVIQSVLDDKYLTYEQIEELSGKFTKPISLIFKSLFWSGCRVSELINIKLSDVKLEGNAIIRILGKGVKEHVVYLPLKLYNEIREFFNGKEYLFETAGRKQFHRVNISKEIKRQAKKYGFNIGAHTLRHSRAMHLKDEMGLSADKISKALGHSDPIVTTRSYFHGSPSAEEMGVGEYVG
jgi:integrase